MDSRFLITFLEVANTRHFGKAAENLYLTQSAVSARIKQLEMHYNAALFIRHRNSIQLTSAGEKLKPFAEKICNTMADAKKALQALQADFFVCAGTQLISELFLPNLINHLSNRFSNPAIRAEVMPIDKLSRRLHERTLDVAFSSEPLKSEELVSDCLLKFELAMYSVNSTGSDVTSESFVSIDWGSKVQEQLMLIDSKFNEATFFTNSIQFALSSLRNDKRLIVLPSFFDCNEWPALNIKKLHDIPNAYSFVYMNYMKSAGRAGLDTVIDQIKSSYLNGAASE